MIYQAIVFLPLAGALIAGFLGRLIGPRPSEVVTTGLLGIAAVLSWIAFWNVGFGGETAKVPVLRWGDPYRADGCRSRDRTSHAREMRE